MSISVSGPHELTIEEVDAVSGGGWVMALSLGIAGFYDGFASGSIIGGISGAVAGAAAGSAFGP